MKSNVEAYDAREEEGRADGVELLDPIAECLAVVGWTWDMEDEGRNGNDDGANRKIDIETPSPGDPVRKCTPEQWSDDRRNAEHSTYETSVHGSFV